MLPDAGGAANGVVVVESVNTRGGVEGASRVSNKCAHTRAGIEVPVVLVKKGLARGGVIGAGVAANGCVVV